MAYVAGFSQGATWRISGGGSPTTLFIVDYDWKEEVEKLIATHTGTGGIQALVAGVLSGDCTISANTDAAALPQSGANQIRAGNKGAITLAVASASPFSIPTMIVSVNHKSSISTLVNYNFTVSLDAFTGSYTYAS